MNNINILIVAGGSGKRFSKEKSKLFVELNSIPLIFYSIKFFLEKQNNKIFLVISPNNKKEFINSSFIKNINLNRIIMVESGKERSNSVYNGLNAIKKYSPNRKFVMIHDSARPLLDEEVINNMVKESKKNGKCIVPILPLNDTICKINGNSIISYPNRSNLKRIQTPQLFNFQLLHKNLKDLIEKEEILTDESSLMLKNGFIINYITGSEKMLKITYKHDLKLLESYLLES